MSLRLLTPAATLALAAAATAAPIESVTYTNVNSASSQVNGGTAPTNDTGANGVELRSNSFTGAYSVKKIRLTAASLSRVDLDTFPSEARIFVTPPVGTAFILQPLDTTNWPDPATIAIDSFVQPLATPVAAAGSWSFRFFESFQDGVAGAANSIWDAITFSLDDGIAVPPPGTVDLGTLAPGSPAAVTNVPLTAGGVKWFKVVLPAVPAPASNFVDIDTEGSLLAPNNATFVALFDVAGDVVDTDTDDGSGSLSQLSFGAGYRSPIGDGVRYDGRNGTLVGGVYYIAVSGTPAAAANDLTLDAFGADAGTINLSLRSGSYTPAGFAVLPDAPATGSIAETENNNSKSAANPVRLAPGNTITGTTTGSSTAVNGITSADYYLVYTDRQPGVIKRYQLTCVSATTGHTVTLRGLSQSAPGPGPSAPVLGSDVAAQTSLTTTSPPRYVQWYALGTALTPAVYARVTGVGATTQPYTLTLEAQTITPTVITGGPLDQGVITINTVGTTGPVQTDTEVWLYDSNLDPIALAGNDDNSVLAGGSGAGRGSLLVRSLVPGTYYLAVSELNMASNQVSPGDDRFKTGSLLDFPGVISTSSASAAGLNLSFTIADSSHPARTVTASQVGPYDIRFFQFIVQNDAAVRCNAADVAQLGGAPGADGQNTVDDIIVFLDAFFSGNAAIADIAILGGAPGSDGLLTADDIIFFLGQFFSPCNI